MPFYARRAVVRAPDYAVLLLAGSNTSYATEILMRFNNNNNNNSQICKAPYAKLQRRF